MDRINGWFVRANLIYFLVGTFLGLLIAAHPRLLVQFRTAHVHLTLSGVMTMMIFGVGHHIFPRFSGRPLYSRRLVAATFCLGHVGVLGLSLGFGLGVATIVASFGMVMFLAVLAIVVTLLRPLAAPAPAGLGCEGSVVKMPPFSIRPPRGG